MNILQICSKPPYPKKDGYALAINHITNALIKKGHTLKVIAISTPKHKAGEVPQQYLEETNFEHVFINTNIKILSALKNLFSKSSYNTNRFYSHVFTKRLKEILQEYNFDIILLEGLFVCPYLDVISNNSNAKIVLRAHNVESNIWKGLVKNTTNLIKKFYMNLLQKKLFNYEKTIVSKMDGIICISKKDMDWMQQQTQKNITTIPFAIHTEEVIRGHVKSNTLFHIGSMDWMSNLNGVKWFLNKTFPLIKHEEKEAILHLAGRNMPNYFNNLSSKNIVVHGEVENAKIFMKQYNLMIVPIWSGSGIRIKILEAMALGKTIISTSIGASGINYNHNKNILIADTAKEFAKQIIWCFNNPLKSQKIGKNAMQNIKENYNSERINTQLNSFLKEIYKS